MLTFFIAEQGRAQTYQRTSQGIKSTVQGINIDISFFSPVTVRILKSPDGWKYTKESLSVIGQPEKVKLSVSSKGGILTIKSHQLTVHLNEETGQITFAYFRWKNRCCRNKIKDARLMIQRCRHKNLQRLSIVHLRERRSYLWIGTIAKRQNVAT